MSSAECLRQFVSERLTAAAEEIFRVFKQTIVEYEEEIDRQRRLLDICWKPEVKLYRIDQLQLYVCKEEEEEVLTDQQLCNQERDSSLDQEDPEAPQIKDEQEELCSSQEGEQLVLKQETDTFMCTLTHEENDHSEPDEVCKEGEEEVLTDQQLCNQERNSSLDQEDPEPPQIKEEQEELCSSQEGEQLVLKQETDTFMCTLTHEENDHSEPEAGSYQLLSNISLIVESQDQKGDNHGDSRSSRDAEPKPNKRHHKRSHTNNVSSEIKDNNNPGKKCFKCDTCRKDFRRKTTLKRHLGRQACQKPRSCQLCGRSFRYPIELKRHLMTHTGERPYKCSHCGRGFTKTSELNIHIRTHTGETPYSCKNCDKKFCRKSELNAHIRIHTGERPHSCKTCGKDFRFDSELKVHMRIHTGERPHLCDTCGKTFNYLSALKNHIVKLHTGEK